MAEMQIEGLADLGREEADRQIQEAIEAALRALPEGESDGSCDDCGAAIEPERLALLPGTTQCSSCARTRAKLGASARVN